MPEVTGCGAAAQNSSGGGDLSATRRPIATLKLRSRLTDRLESLALADRPAPSPLRLGVVLVAWDEERTTACVQVLRQLGARAATADLVVVANRTQAVGCGLDPVVRVVRGSNREAEFSGYDEGVHALRSTSPVDVWFLANDRLLGYEDGYVDLLHPAVLRLAHDEQVLLGWVDRLPVDDPVRGHRVPVFCRSNYLMVAERTLLRIGAVTSVDNEDYDDMVGTGDHERLGDVAGSDLPASYLAYLDDWLTGRGGNGNAVWYRAGDASAQQWSMLRHKLHSIVNEHLFSARARQAGAVLVGPRQAALLARLPPDSPLRRRLLSTMATEPGRAWGYSFDRAERLRTAATAAVRVGLRGRLLPGRGLVRTRE